MIFISRIKMRGFKSFKLADLMLPKDFVCFVGPNGSGKSNVCDAIRFAFGEKSLRAMRVRKVKDLISHNAKVAEVTVYLDGDEKHEIRRAIREDGKILYKLDNERTTRTSVLDLLKKFNIDESGRNVIAQGEVTRIINMNPKDRREIIDSVAGISEFEDKKSEAMRDVEVVDTRLRETNLILGEKIGMLNELEKEKEVALKYVENKKIFNNARGSIITNESHKLTSELEKAINDIQKLSNSLRIKNGELAELESRIKVLEEEKGTFLNEIQKRQQQNSLLKIVEDIRMEVAKSANESEERKKQGAKIDSDLHAQFEEQKKQLDELKTTEDEYRKNEEELNVLRPKKEEALKLAGSSSLRKLIEDQKAKMAQLREEAIKAESEITRCLDLAKEKAAFSEAHYDSDEKNPNSLKGEMELLKKEIIDAKKEMDDLFEKEKDLNGEVADLDKRILQSREQLAAIRAQNPHLSSGALANMISQMKFKEKGSGTYGALIDLIKFDSRYSNAIEAAAGARLRYIVVDSADVATKIISEMKKSGEGRATFIPLREIRAPEQSASKEGMGPIINYVKCDAMFEVAARYALGDTILVKDMAEAKRIGVGKSRMVTLDGEIFEKSGVISGGKLATGIAAVSAIAKLDSEVSELKTMRDTLYSEISSVREQMSSLRALRAGKEVKSKSLEMELAAIAGESERMKKEAEDAERKEAEARSLRAKADSLNDRKAEIEHLIAEHTKKINEDEKLLAKEEEHTAKLNEEANRKRTELFSKISAFETKKEALVNEVKLRKTALHKLEGAMKQLQNERSVNSSRISELERKMKNDKDQLAKKEQELASSSKESDSLFKKMKESDQKILELGKLKGALVFECDKLIKESTAIGTKKTIAETKLVDMKAELDSFGEFIYLEKTKEELMEMSKTSDAFLSAHQNVNLSSIEIYDKKKAEIGDVNDKIKKLSEEKEAVLNMIKEIDLRKKETFFKSFYAISENFKKMFKHIPSVGEGYLSLNKPVEPFESGLYIKVKRGAKEIELDSLSGGEKSLVVIMFIFALQFVKPSPYYILDEADSALDKENSKNLAKLVRETSRGSQFLVVTHDDVFMTFASAVFGVSKSENVSKVVGVKLGEKIIAQEQTVAAQS